MPSQVSLSWSAATDNGAVFGYLVLSRRRFRSPRWVRRLATHVDEGVANLTNHSYTVTAVDGDGNE